MTARDDAPAHGIRRPTPIDLAEADEMTVIAATLRAEIRAAFATALLRVRGWEPGL
jgi:hypothetical protein